MEWFPNSLVGLLAVIAGFITFLLPETKDQKLPDTSEEAEIFGTKAAAAIQKNLEKDAVVSQDKEGVDNKEFADDFSRL